MSEQVDQTKNKKPVIFIILLIILLIALIVVGYLYFNTKKQVDGLISEKEQIKIELQSELDSLLYQHNRVKSDYGQLSDSLLAKDSLIIANAKEIKQLLNYKWEYYQVKKKIARLQIAAQGYVRQMDSLYTVNHELKKENERIRENYRTEIKKNTNLIEEKKELIEIVDQAAVLHAYNIVSRGIRQRGSRQTETDKANRTDRVRVCFTLGENSLVEPGKKTIYLRIARPDNAILVFDNTDEYAFMLDEKKLQFSLKREVEYVGEALDLCLYWDKWNADSKAMPGRYHVSLYTENAKIGESFFVLK
jgi:Tfp pilus assembly protein PilO